MQIGAGFVFAAFVTGIGCHTATDTTQTKPQSTAPSAERAAVGQGYPEIGKIERLHSKVNELIPADAKIEKLAEGFDWSEGPVWIKKGDYLLFSDVPKNIVYMWREGEDITEFLKPSGYTGSKPRGGEPGSNGLAVDSQGRLVLCQHGDRRVARLEPKGKGTVIAQYYQFRRFNSPNDLVFHSNGDLYFTDPPYGLEKQNQDPAKELLINGVYRVKPNGQVTLIIKDLTYPNGIALSPDEKILYVAVSDPKRPVIMAYEMQRDGTVQNGRVFFNAAKLMTPDRKGLPDGLKVDQRGNLFATGPGGVLIIGPDAEHLGTLNTGEATANCGWGNDGSVLYITADMYLCRVKTKTKGLGF
jgi:gluconolactonase